MVGRTCTGRDALYQPYHPAHCVLIILDPLQNIKKPSSTGRKNYFAFAAAEMGLDTKKSLQFQWSCAILAKSSKDSTQV